MEAKPEAEELTCIVDSYSINIKLTGNKLIVRAYSENSIKLFTG